MRRFLLIAFSLAALPQFADAQYAYPGGYGRYGYGYGAGGVNIANNPAAGFMAGLGTYARDKGVYQVENAQAQSINLDTMLKWNKALRARQSELRAQQQKDANRQEAERQNRVVRYDLESGTTLNNLLLQILQFDPSVVKSAQAKAQLTPAVLHEIPFEWDTEAITICLDQLTGKDSLPVALQNSRYLPQRSSMRSAIEAAIKEDSTGNVSDKTAKAASNAIDAFHDVFVKNTDELSPGFDEASSYFSTVAALVRLLNDPSMKKILASLDKDKPRSLGEVIAFMNAFNLRFGPATSPRQIAIYEQLAPALAALRDSIGSGQTPPTPPANGGEDLKSAAKGAFSGMKWDELQAHAQGK
jgi:hypothetical protein